MTSKKLPQAPETINGRPWRKVRNPRIRQMHRAVENLDLAIRAQRNREMYRMLVTMRDDAQARLARLEREFPDTQAMCRSIFGEAAR